MRKLLRVGTALAVVLAAGLSYAESQWKQSGSMRLRTEQFDNYKFTGYGIDYTGLQFKWDLTFQPNDMTTVFFQPKYAANAGAPAGNSGGLSDLYLGVHQAYFMHKFVDSFSFTGGRMELNYGDQLVIGPVGWHPIGRSFDGVKGRYSMDSLWVDVLAMKITESANTTTPAASSDIDFGGLYVSYSGAPVVSSIDLYYLMRSASGKAQGAEETLSATGLRLAGEMSGVDFRAEYTTESGKAAGQDREKASQYDVEVGYTIPGDFKARFGVEVFSAGEGYDQLYPTAHKWLGYADLFYRNNISGFVGHVKVPVGDFKIGLDYHVFNRVNTESSVYKFGLNPLSPTVNDVYGTNGTEAAIGTEIDATVNYAFSPAFSGLFGYSTFTPGAYMKDNLSDDVEKAMNMVYLELTAKF